MKNKSKLLVKKTMIALTAGVLAIGAFGCGKADTQQSAADTSASDTAQDTAGTEDTKERQTLRIGVVGNEESGYILELAALAKEKGYFEEELGAVDYDVEYIPFTNGGPEINEALASGAVDAAIYGDFPAFTSKSNGIDTTIIATLNQRMQYAILTGNEEITKPTDLEGKKIVYLMGSVQQYFWEKYAERNQIDTSKVEAVNSSDTASLLQTGSADAAAGNMYVAKYLESLGLGKVLEDPNQGDIYTTQVFTIKSSIIEDTPQVAVAVNKALIRAYEDAAADKEELYDAVATPVMTKEIMKSEYAFDESLWYLSPEITEDTLQYYEELNDWLYENQILKEKVDVPSFVDMQYYEQAKQELGQ